VFFLFDLLYLDGEDLRRRLVAKVKFLTRTEGNLLRQVVYEGLRKDKPAREVRRKAPRPKPDIDGRAADAKTHVARQRRS
jgi:ATP-dependent DNA ligase